jgi:hypothetical protein
MQKYKCEKYATMRKMRAYFFTARFLTLTIDLFEMCGVGIGENGTFLCDAVYGLRLVLRLDRLGPLPKMQAGFCCSASQ